MIKWLSLLLVLLAVIAGGAIWYRGIGRPPQLALMDRPEAVAGAWPLEQQWTWTYSLPTNPSDDMIGLRVRQKRITSSPTTHPDFSLSGRPMSRAEADRRFDSGSMTTRDAINARQTTGTVEIQLLDLAHIGAVSDRPGQKLRILGSVGVGGGRLKLVGEDCYLPGRQFCGYHLQREGQWVGDELYLLTFWVEDEQGIIRFDVLLQTGREE